MTPTPDPQTPRERLAAAGLRPVGTKTILGGTVEHLERELVYGEPVVLVVRAVVTGIGIAKGGAGPVESRTLTLVNAYELEGQRGATVIEALITERHRALDPPTREVLPGFEATLDASGVLVTPTELAGETATPTPKTALDVVVEAGYGDLVTHLVNHTLDIAEAAPPARILRALAEVEASADEPNGELLDVIDEALAAELARMANVEPWDGYAALSVGNAFVYLNTQAEELQRGGAWLDLLEHVAAYETAHKNRIGIRTYAGDELGTKPEEK